MQFPNRYKIATFTLFFVLAGVLAMFATLFIKHYRESRHLAERHTEAVSALAAAKKTIAYQEEYLQQMAQNPEFFERVVRERLGYSRPDEIVFKFADD